MTDTSELCTGIQHREMGSLEVRDDHEDGERSVEGIGVPYNTPIDIMGFREQFAPGAINLDDDVKLFWRHQDPIGRVVQATNTDEGWRHRAIISRTPAGDEAYELAKDGVIDRFSVGFEPVESTETRDDDGGMTITHTKVKLREVSLVPFPAYEGAAMTQVRQEPQEEHMGESAATADDVSELRENIEELNRRVEVGLTPTTSTPGPVARSLGDFVRKLAAGDEQATRAYDGAVSGDAVMTDQWVGDVVEIIRKRQIVADTFARGSLPAKGNTVEYAVLNDDSTQVEEQESEGEDLVFGKVSLDTKTAGVKTLGGWSSMTRQAIERTENVSILDTTFQAMAEKYGRAVERMARKAFEDAFDDADSVDGQIDTQDHVVEALIDLAEHFDDKGLSLDGILVSKAKFKALYGVDADKRILQVSGAPEDKVGQIDVNTVQASLSGIRVRLLPNADDDLVAAYDASSLRTLESGGAPVRLQDDNIINLSRDFSVYGYCAAFVQRPNGIVKLADAS